MILLGKNPETANNEVDPNQSMAEIKKTVQREYKLNPILAIQFIFKVITVMATQAGG